MSRVTSRPVHWQATGQAIINVNSHFRDHDGPSDASCHAEPFATDNDIHVNVLNDLHFLPYTIHGRPEFSRCQEEKSAD